MREIYLVENENKPVISIVSLQESMWQFYVDEATFERWSKVQKAFEEVQEEMGKLIRNSY